MAINRPGLRQVRDLFIRQLFPDTVHTNTNPRAQLLHTKDRRALVGAEIVESQVKKGAQFLTQEDSKGLHVRSVH